MERGVSWRRAAARARARGGFQAVVVVVGLGSAAGAIWTSSQAVYTQATPGAAGFGTGSIALVDDDQGAALFSVASLAPATEIERCVEVTFSGSLDPTSVVLFSASEPIGDLAPFLDLQIDVASDGGAPFGDCSGFSSSTTLFEGSLEAFHSTHDEFATGLVTWDPGAAPAGETRRFRFRASVNDDAAAYGATATFSLAWETRS